MSLLRPIPHFLALSLALVATHTKAQTPTPPSPVSAPAGSFEPTPVSAEAVLEPAPPPGAGKPKPPPYSLPWQLRPVVAGNVVRSDTTVGFYETPTTRGGTVIASTLLASYKVRPEFAPLVRLGLFSNSPPTDKSARTDLMNPVIGGTYAPALHPNFKLALFLGLALPFGTGGGDEPHPQAAPANAAAIRARSAMDNAMFAVNYFTFFPGVGVAYVGHGFTAQAEATLLRLTQARGPKALDQGNTNFTTGLHLGYFLIPELSVGGELRHQRWLSTPTAVKNDKTGTLRDTSTAAIGPRVHLKLGDSTWLRPGLAYVFALDNPMANAKAPPTKFKIVQIDIPFVF